MMDQPDTKPASGDADVPGTLTADVPGTVTDAAENVEQTESSALATLEQHDAEQTKSDDSQPVVKEEQTSETEEDSKIVVDPAVVEKLTTGLLGLFLPNLQKAKGSLNEVLHNQEVLIETVMQENAKFTESTSMKQLTETMQKARIYHSKLLNLKKEMNNLMDRSTKLKKRAVKLQQQKHKEVLDRAVQRDRELDREKMLTAKVARHPDKASSSSKDSSS